MNPKPAVSVCVPVYKPGVALVIAIQSVLDQTFTDFEVIIVNDSPDVTVDLPDDHRVRYIPNDRRLGFNRNHSHALDLAAGEFVAILHQDDAWEAEFLEQTVGALRRDPKLGFVITRVRDIDAEGRSMGERPTRTPPGVIEDPLAVFLAGDFMVLVPSALLFRAEALEANERPWPDIDAWWDLALYYDVVQAGWSVALLPELLSNYRSHPGQSSGNAIKHRTAVVNLYSRYQFQEPRFEARRRQLLAKALVARAGALLRLGRPDEARSDLQAARREDSTVSGPRWRVLNVLARVPALVSVASAMWALFHDPTRSRHQGL